jgi:hypothetical protein
LPLGRDDIWPAPAHLGGRAGLSQTGRHRDRHRRTQASAVGSRLDSEQHVQRVHRRLESRFEDGDLRLGLRERSFRLGIGRGNFVARLVLTLAKVPVLGETAMRLRSPVVERRIMEGGVCDPVDLEAPPGFEPGMEVLQTVQGCVW